MREFLRRHRSDVILVPFVLVAGAVLLQRGDRLTGSFLVMFGVFRTMWLLGWKLLVRALPPRSFVNPEGTITPAAPTGSPAPSLPDEARAGVPASELRVGTLVEYVGGPIYCVMDPAKQGPAGVVRSGHPGVVHYPDPMHVIVSWVGLEDEPVSIGVGFTANAQLIVPDLRLLTPEEFAERRRAVIATQPWMAAD